MKNLAILDDTRERGVQNPKVIDLIQPSEAGDAVELVMIETRAWGSAAEQKSQLEEKLNNYLDYVLGGFFSEQFPQYKQLPVHFVLECPAPPSEYEQQMLSVMEQFCRSVGIGFHARQVERDAV